MKCPHCKIEIHTTFEKRTLGSDQFGEWLGYVMNCPNNECRKLIVKIMCLSNYGNFLHPPKEYFGIPIYPFIQKAPPEVDDDIAQDFNEASLILNLSPKASAALSRRCLQNVIQNKANIKGRDLADEIQQLLDKGQLPSQLAESIDLIRNLGNFSAHPTKSKSTGQIIDVEKGETEWSIEVLLMLFDYYYVQPSNITERRKALNEKLKEAGKPPSK